MDHKQYVPADEGEWATESSRGCGETINHTPSAAVNSPRHSLRCVPRTPANGLPLRCTPKDGDEHCARKWQRVTNRPRQSRATPAKALAPRAANLAGRQSSNNRRVDDGAHRRAALARPMLVRAAASAAQQALCARDSPRYPGLGLPGGNSYTDIAAARLCRVFRTRSSGLPAAALPLALAPTHRTNGPPSRHASFVFER